LAWQKILEKQTWGSYLKILMRNLSKKSGMLPAGRPYTPPYKSFRQTTKRPYAKIVPMEVPKTIGTIHPNRKRKRV